MSDISLAAIEVSATHLYVGPILTMDTIAGYVFAVAVPACMLIFYSGLTRMSRRMSCCFFSLLSISVLSFVVVIIGTVWSTSTEWANKAAIEQMSKSLAGCSGGSWCHVLPGKSLTVSRLGDPRQIDRVQKFQVTETAPFKVGIDYEMADGKIAQAVIPMRCALLSTTPVIAARYPTTPADCEAR